MIPLLFSTEDAISTIYTHTKNVGTEILQLF